MSRRWRTALAGLAALVLLAIPVGTWMTTRSTQAAFTDHEELGVNRLGTGRLAVAVGSATTSLAGDAVAPGDRLVGALELVNDGSLPLRFELYGHVDGAELAPWVEWSVGEAVASGCRDPRILSGPIMIDDGETARLIAFTNARRISDSDHQLLCVVADVSIDAPNSVQARRIELTLEVVAEHDLDPGAEA